MSKVVKFGGSSLASAEQFKKVGNIIRADKERKYVVPSAPGKRFSDDTKVTDMLYACYDLADQGKSFKAELDAIKARYQEIIDGLQLDLDLVDEFKTIEKNFKAQEILANYKDADLIYAAAGKAVGSLIVQYEETDWEFLQRVLSREGIMITPDCRQPGLKLYAGVPELMESAFPCHILDMEKDMDGYYELKANGREVHRILPAIRSFQNSLWESLIRSGYRKILLWFMHADIPLKIRRCRELINYKVQRGLQGL